MKAIFSNLNVNDHQIKAIVTIGGQKQDISLSIGWDSREVTGTVGDGLRKSRIKQVVIDKINAIYLYQ